jgi:hypothetical protein
MSDFESHPEFDSDDALRPLQRTLFPVICLFGLFLLLSIVCMGMFIYQLLHRDAFGDLYIYEPGAWLHLVGHLLRSGVAAGLALCLFNYLLAIRRSSATATGHIRRVSVSIAYWWYTLATGMIVLLIYAALTTFYFTTADPSSRHISPRFRYDPADAPVQVEFRLAEQDPDDELMEATIAGTSRTIYLHETPIITNEDVFEARAALDDDGSPVIDIRLSPAAGERMRTMTRAHVGSLLAILIDDEVVQAPTINAPIGDRARIRGEFSEDQAGRIARSLAGKH